MTAPTLPTDTPWSLVERAQAGDMDAFAEIWRANHVKVYVFTLNRVRSSAHADDITSEVFIRLLRSLGRINYQGRDIAAYLITTARNMIADWYKSGRYRFEAPVGEVLGYDLADDDWGVDTERVVEAHELSAEVADALGRLSPEHRQCLMLRFFGGLSVEETAQALGRSHNATKSLQYRASQAMAGDERMRALVPGQRGRA